MLALQGGPPGGTVLLTFERWALPPAPIAWWGVCCAMFGTHLPCRQSHALQFPCFLQAHWHRQGVMFISNGSTMIDETT